MKAPLKYVTAAQLPAGSFERFLLEIGVKGSVATTRPGRPSSEFDLIPLRGIDTVACGGLELFAPSANSARMDRIRIRVRDRTYALLRVEWNYAVSRFIVDCLDVTPGATDYALGRISIGLLRTRMGMKVERGYPDLYPPPRRESWLKHMWRALLAGSYAY